ncbi:MAG: SH3 domain-containing protein [Chloroflexi bacterium]|nr:SH3 domain-containing protein [Chloroflexota bacterium]
MAPLMPISSEDEPTARRRTHAWWEALHDEEKARLFGDLAGRAIPTFDFFLFMLAAAGLMVLAYGLRSPALQVAAALAAPLLSPLPGLSLGAAAGSVRHVVLAAAASAWLALRLARAPSEARLPSAALSFLLLVPTATAGWSLGAGEMREAAAALGVVLVYASIAFVAGLIAYLVLGIRPALGAVLGAWGPAVAGLAAAGMILLAFLLLSRQGPSGFVFVPTLTPTATASAPPSLTPSPTPPPTPSATLAPSLTPAPSSTPTSTPLPVAAIVWHTDGKGAFLRSAPDGDAIGSLFEGALIEILGEPIEASGRMWVLVRDAQGHEGWLAVELCATVTPTPAA